MTADIQQEIDREREEELIKEELEDEVLSVRARLARACTDGPTLCGLLCIFAAGVIGGRNSAQSRHCKQYSASMERGYFGAWSGRVLLPSLCACDDFASVWSIGMLVSHIREPSGTGLFSEASLMPKNCAAQSPKGEDSNTTPNPANPQEPFQKSTQFSPISSILLRPLATFTNRGNA